MYKRQDGALVLTGVQTYQDVIEAVPNQRPTYILRTLEDFFAPYPEIEVLYEGYEVTATGPTWQARVRGENLSLTGPEIEDAEAFAGSESEAEAWRVACACLLYTSCCALFSGSREGDSQIFKVFWKFFKDFLAPIKRTDRLRRRHHSADL